MRADKKSHLKADKKPPGRSHKRGVVGYSKKSALLEEAITQMNAGKYGRSSAALKELLALDPSNMEARRLFATLHLRLGSLIPARQAFDALITEAFERQDYWLAESLLREYLAAGPRCVPFLEKLGGVYQEKGDIDEAVAEFGKAIDILIEDPNPDNPEQPSQLYAKIRELAPASPVAIRLAPLFDAQTGALIARPAPVVPDGEPAEGELAGSQGPLLDDAPPSVALDHAQAEPQDAIPPQPTEQAEVSSEPLAPSVASPDHAADADRNGTVAAPAAADLDEASKELGRFETLTEPPAAALDESAAGAILQSDTIESALSEPAPVPEIPDLLKSEPSGMLTEPEAEVPEASGNPDVPSGDATVPAPMPWEDIQEANIEISLPPSDEETAAIHLSAVADLSAPAESRTVSDADPATPVQQEQLSQQEQSSLNIDLLKSGGFSWESVFDRAWKFGSKAEPTEPPPDKVEEPEGSVVPEPAGGLGSGDDAPAQASATATESALPWDQIEDTPVSIPPAPERDASLQPAVSEADISASSSTSTESAADDHVSPLASTLHRMPWDQVQDSVVTIPPPTPDEDVLAPIEQRGTIAPAPSSIDEKLVEPSSSVNSDSLPPRESEFRLAADPPHHPVSETAYRQPAAVGEPERQDAEQLTPEEPDLGFRLSVEEPADSPPASVLNESPPVEAPPEVRPPVSIPAPVPQTDGHEDLAQSEALRTQPEKPDRREAAPAPLTMTSDSLPAMPGVPETSDGSSRNLAEELLAKIVSFQEETSPVSADTAPPSTPAVQPMDEAPPLPSADRAQAGVPHISEEPRSADIGKPAVWTEATQTKEEWIRTGESIKFVEPASTGTPATLWRDPKEAVARRTVDRETAATGERPREAWIRTGESIRFLDPEVPLDEAHLRPPAEAPTEPGRSSAAAAVDVLFSNSGRQTDTASRPVPVEPRRRNWLKSRVARLRIAIITFVWSCFSTTQAIVRSIVALILLGLLTTAVTVGVVGLTWVIMEQPPSATYQSFTTAPERKLSDSKRNGYLLLLGFDAPGVDPIQAGYERKPDGKDAERIAGCLNGRGGTRGGHADASANVANGWFHDADPVSRFASHEETIKSWVSQRESELARYRQWLKLPFEDWGYGQTVAPPCGSILFAHQLYVAEGFTLGTEPGIDRLEADMEAWRAALAQARTLPVKMMAVQAVQDDITVASGLLANADLDGKQLPRLTKLLRPLDAGERSIRWPMQSELVTAAKTFDAQVKAERGDDPPLYAAVASLLPLPKQRRLNEYAAYYDASAKAAGDGHFGSMPKRAQHVRFPADSLTAYLTNPIENIIGLEPLSEWDRHGALVIDAEAHLRLASLQAWLRRGPQDADLLGRIAKAGQHFYDPYTGLPMLVNLKKGALYSVGHDGKDQDADPHDDIVAAIPMGPWSTSKTTSPSSRGK